MQQSRNYRDMVAGLFFSACGLFAITSAAELPMGTAARMASGYFPTTLGYLLTILGIVIAIKGAFTQSPQNTDVIHYFDFKIVLTVGVSVAAFALLLPYLGLFVSLSAMVALSAFANLRPSLKETIGLIVFINLFVWFVFIVLIDLHAPMWPSLAGAL